jgi:hypothetical protein
MEEYAGGIKTSLQVGLGSSFEGDGKVMLLEIVSPTIHVVQRAEVCLE